MLNKENVVIALVKLGVDVNYGSPPPITIAASMGRENSLSLLIEHGANVNAEVLLSCMMSYSDHIQMSFCVIACSIVAIRTALDLAENFKRDGIVGILRKAGGRKGQGAILGHHP
jgi:ankyrin repeat protein